MNILLKNIDEGSNIIVLGDANCAGIDNNAFDTCKKYLESKNKDVEVIRSQEVTSEKMDF